MFETQSSPSNSKPDNELFPDLATKPAPKSARAPSSLRKPPSLAAGLPLPPSMRKPPVARVETIEEVEIVADEDVETVDTREVRDYSETEALPLAVADAELIADEPIAEASPLDTLGKNIKTAAPILPKYDAELDDGPTVALPSSVANPPPTSRPAPLSKRLPAPLPAPRSSALKSAPLPPLPNPPSSRPSASAPVSTPVPSRKPSTPPASARVPTGLLRTGSSVAPPAAALAPAPVAAAVAPSADSGRLSSIPPVAESLAPPPPAQRRRSVLPWLAAAAVFVLVGGAGVGFAATQGSTLGFGSGSPGSVVVTAAGEGGKAISGLRVLVDGEERCSASPCRIDDVKAGTRLVTATAPGYESTAARAVSVAAGGESALHIGLTPVAKAERAGAEATAVDSDKPAKVEAKPEPASKATAANTKATSTKASRKSAAKAKPTDKPAKSEKPAPAAMGTLNINSIPRANVVLDGRPMGMTPVMGVSVSPGNHTAVFIHPEQGRKVAGANVKAGGTATVAVRF